MRTATLGVGLLVGMVMIPAPAGASTGPRADLHSGISLGADWLAGALSLSAESWVLQGALSRSLDPAADTVWPTLQQGRWEPSMRVMRVLSRSEDLAFGALVGGVRRDLARGSAIDPVWYGEAGLSASYRFFVPWFGGPTALTVVPTLTCTVWDGGTLGLGPTSGLELALTLARGWEVTVGGGSWVGLRLSSL